MVYVIGTGAPPVRDWPALMRLLCDRGWEPYPALSEAATEWCDLEAVAEAADAAPRTARRGPGEPDPWPRADAVLAAPLTFNTINKWAGGTNDSLILGLLNELMGEGLPTIAAPCAKAVLRTHPAYTASVKRLQGSGVTFLDPEHTVVRDDDGTVHLRWTDIADAVDAAYSR